MPGKGWSMSANTEPELADLDPFVLMAGEAARIEAFYRATRNWRAPTRCAGWNRRDLLAHLAGVEDDTAARLTGRPLPASYVSEVALTRRAHLPDQKLLADWCAQVDRNDAELRQRGPHATLPGPDGKPYPLGRWALHLASERAIHADDAGVPVSGAEAEARLDWRLRFARSALTEIRNSQVGVVADRGAQVVHLMDDMNGDAVRLPDDQFVEAVSGRLAPEADVPARLRKALAVLG
jgi:uncharacterized protein (TIGR03083 family)